MSPCIFINCVDDHSIWHTVSYSMPYGMVIYIQWSSTYNGHVHTMVIYNTYGVWYESITMTVSVCALRGNDLILLFLQTVKRHKISVHYKSHPCLTWTDSSTGSSVFPGILHVNDTPTSPNGMEVSSEHQQKTSTIHDVCFAFCGESI